MEVKRPQSRRDRPAKAPLSRDAIIQAALHLTEAGSAVTMRSVAEALDTGAASLYVYVRNTEDLHAHMLDGLLDRLRGVRLRGTWREKLVDLMGSYVQLLFEYPTVARLTMTTRPSGPHYLALVELILALLVEGGVPDRDAAWAVDLLLMHASADAVEHAQPRPDEDDFAALAKTVRDVDRARHPTLARLGDELFSGTPRERTRWQVEVLLSGVLATPRAASPETEKKKRKKK